MIWLPPAARNSVSVFPYKLLTSGWTSPCHLCLGTSLQINNIPSLPLSWPSTYPATYARLLRSACPSPAHFRSSAFDTQQAGRWLTPFTLIIWIVHSFIYDTSSSSLIMIPRYRWVFSFTDWRAICLDGCLLTPKNICHAPLSSKHMSIFACRSPRHIFRPLLLSPSWFALASLAFSFWVGDFTALKYATALQDAGDFLGPAHFYGF